MTSALAKNGPPRAAYRGPVVAVADVVRRLVWTVRHRRGSAIAPMRPSLDAVDFGRTECVVLDVGANLGGFAGNVLVRAPLARVHCFEPNSELLPELYRNADRYGRLGGRPRCVVNAVGVGSREEVLELLVTEFHGASSFLPAAAGLRKGWPQVDFEERRRETAKVIRLEDYMAEHALNEVKLLKIDVQGLELEVLRGCGERLKQVEYLLAEVQFSPLYEGAPLWHEIVAYSRDFGFRPILMDGLCFDPQGGPLQADILLERDSD